MDLPVNPLLGEIETWMQTPAQGIEEVAVSRQLRSMIVHIMKEAVMADAPSDSNPTN